jgi:cytochrome c553
MPCRRFACCLAVLGMLAIGGVPARAAEVPATPEQIEFFEKAIRPMLVENCQRCHGPQKQQGGLRLDSRAAALTGGDSGPAVVAGNPADSLLVSAVHYEDGLQMPPKGKLSADEIAALTNWVKQGAPWPEAAEPVRPPAPERGFTISEKDRGFWSFQPIVDHPLPQVNDSDWPQSTPDFFVLAQLEANGLTPAPPADKLALIRRATFDLIGLPPTPEEIQAFIEDSSPDAYVKLIDRLLESPHYGERWARHWLDVARYGEDQAHTFQARKYPEGYRYRDWLIDAFNSDMPYDRFIREQIAADLLEAPDRRENLPALGFFALGPVYYGDKKMLDQYDDRIDTLTRGFFGLTVACARCHDHKYDPISTEDYYALAGVFASTEYEETPLVSPEEVEAAKEALTEDEKKKKVRPKYPFVHALKEAEKPVNLPVHIRGNPENLGHEVPRRFLSIFAADKPELFAQGSGRLELAEAIASEHNPLTARVLVNRMWKHHFGRGIVASTSNFGVLGERPTHPELLDHLAARFIASGWSMKWLHREIVLSAAYQQSTRFDSQNFEIDPENRLLWRMNRRRLEVEAWRDAMLAVSGQLDRTIGGPSLDLSSSKNRRRTLYGEVSRHDLHPLLRLFDFPDPNITSDERPITTVPLQQLFVLNSEFMIENAQALATRLTADENQDDADRIATAFRLVYGRPATDRELQLGLDFLAASDSQSDETTGKDRLNKWEQYAQVLLCANEFLYVD